MESLIRQLRERGLEIDPEALADALWLAGQLGAITPVASVSALPDQSASSEVKGETRPGSAQVPGGSSADVPPVQPLRAPKKVSQQVRSADVYRPSHSGLLGAGLSAIGYRAPSLPALPRSRELAMALRPLLRRVPRSGRWQLDEDETVRRIVEERIWLPAMQQDRSRWAELALVVDRNDTMKVWGPTIAELRRLLERHGAFRDVRTWGLDTAASRVRPQLRTREMPGSRPRERDVKELLDPTGRRVILVLTDCMAPIWGDGRLADVLDEWGQNCPLAILQVLPPRLWPRTPLGLPTLKLSAREPGLPNSRLQANPATLRRGTIGIPILTLDKDPLSRWARVVSGQGRVWVQGVASDRFRQIPVEADLETDWDFDAADEPVGRPTPPDAQERLARFGKTASGPARELASNLAGLPLSLPVIRLVHQLLVPAPQHAHIAELFFSDLLVRTTPETEFCDPDDVEYDFYPGIRDLLLEGRTDEEVKAVSGRVVGALSQFVSGEAGRVTSFTAALADPAGKGTIMLPPGSRRVAQVTAEALRRYGGEYAELAQRLQDAPETDGVTLRQRGETLDGHNMPIGHIAWSPDGNLLASASLDGTVRIWSLDGEERQIIHASPSWISVFAWSPDSGYLATASDKVIQICETMNWQVTQVLEQPDPFTTTLAWSPDGHRLASGTSEGVVQLWNLATSEAQLIYSAREMNQVTGGEIRQVAWSPSGNRLAVVSAYTQLLLVWDFDRSVNPALCFESDEDMWSIAWQPDGGFLFAGSESGRILAWNWDTLDELIMSTSGAGAPIPMPVPIIFHEHHGIVSSLALSADNRIMGTKSQDGTVKLWCSSPWRVVAIVPEVPSPSSPLLGGLAFHPYQALLATLSPGAHSIRLWDVTLETEVRLRTYKTDGTVKIGFRPQAGEPLPQFLLTAQLPPQDWRIGRLVWSPIGHLLATATESGAITVWDVETGEMRISTHDDTQQVYGISWSPLGHGLAWGVGGQGVKLWDLGTRTDPLLHIEKTVLLPFSAHRIYAVAWSPDGQWLAAGGTVGCPSVWNSATQQILAAGEEEQYKIYALAWSPDSTMLAVAGTDRSVRRWRLEASGMMPNNPIIGGMLPLGLGMQHRPSTGLAPLPSLNVPHGPINSLAWSSQGMLAAGLEDHTIRLWDAEGMELRTLHGHGSPIIEVAWSADGRWLASKTRGSVRLWDVQKGVMVTLLKEVDPAPSGYWPAGLAFHPTAQILATLDETSRGVRIWGLFKDVVLPPKEIEAESLVAALKSDVPEIRAEAARVLKKAGYRTPDVIRALIATLNDTSSDIRYAVTSALGAVGRDSAEAVQALALALLDPDSEVRSEARYALGMVGNVKLTLEEARSIRISDARSVSRTVMLPEMQDEQPDKVLQRALRAIQGIGDAGLRTVALATLALNLPMDQRPEMVRLTLEAALSITDTTVRSEVLTILTPDLAPDLLKALQTGTANVRSTAADALGMAGQSGPESLQALAEALNDKSSEVQAAAARALGQIGQQTPATLRGLLRALRAKNKTVRFATATALGNVGQGSPEVSDALRSTLNDRDTDVRNAAREALEKLRDQTSATSSQIATFTNSVEADDKSDMPVSDSSEQSVLFPAKAQDAISQFLANELPVVLIAQGGPESAISNLVPFLRTELSRQHIASHLIHVDLGTLDPNFIADHLIARIAEQAGIDSDITVLLDESSFTNGIERARWLDDRMNWLINQLEHAGDRWIIVLEGFETAKPDIELNHLIDRLVMRPNDGLKGIRIVLVNDLQWVPQLPGKGTLFVEVGPIHPDDIKRCARQALQTTHPAASDTLINTIVAGVEQVVGDDPADRLRRQGTAFATYVETAKNGLLQW